MIPRPPTVLMSTETDEKLVPLGEEAISALNFAVSLLNNSAPLTDKFSFPLPDDPSLADNPCFNMNPIPDPILVVAVKTVGLVRDLTINVPLLLLSVSLS